MGNYVSTFHWELTGEEHYMSARMDQIGDQYMIFETRPEDYLDNQANFAYGIEGWNRMMNLYPVTNLTNFSNEVIAAFPDVKISYQINYHPTKYLSYSPKETIPTKYTSIDADVGISMMVVDDEVNLYPDRLVESVRPSDHHYKNMVKIE